MVLAGTAALFCVGAANAQVSGVNDSFHSATVSATESSSTDSTFVAGSGDVAGASGDPAAPSLSEAGGQYDNKSSYKSGWKDRLAVEFGTGFNVPDSDTSPYINTGYQINAGGGFHLAKAISLLAEYQFIRDGLPSNIAEQAGVDGGNVHIWSLTLNPVVNLMPKRSTSVYLTGGGGFYRKVTNFTVQTPEEYCTYFYCGIGYTPETVGHFSSNQGGWSTGGGVSHRFAGAYGDGKMAFFVEARYLDVLSPAILNQSANGLGNTTIGEGTVLVPVTFGLRF